MGYAMTVRVRGGFGPTLERVRAALKDQGFGVLTEIDMRSTLREKLGVDLAEYVILGACNPPLAHRAVQADVAIGLLLPCNVVVRADGPDAIVVQALDPQVMVRLSDAPELRAVADEAAGRLRAALDAVSA